MHADAMLAENGCDDPRAKPSSREEPGQVRTRLTRSVAGARRVVSARQPFARRAEGERQLVLRVRGGLHRLHGRRVVDAPRQEFAHDRPRRTGPRAQPPASVRSGEDSIVQKPGSRKALDLGLARFAGYAARRERGPQLLRRSGACGQETES